MRALNLMSLLDDIGCLDLTRSGVQRENQRVFECIFIIIRGSGAAGVFSLIDQSATLFFGGPLLFTPESSTLF